MEDQTNNRIREEWKEWAFTHKQHLGRMCDRKEIEDYWISKLDSLLKTQREELVEKITKDILDEIEQYIVSAKAIKINKQQADFVYWYDVKLAIKRLLSNLSNNEENENNG